MIEVYGEATRCLESSHVFQKGSSLLSIRRIQVLNCWYVTRAARLQGVILAANSSQLDGGAIFVGKDADLVIGGGWIHDNVAGSFGGTDNNGGGIHAEGTLTLANVRINDNLASGVGAGISQYGGTVKLTNVILHGNFSAEPNGGAIRIMGAEATLSHTAVVKNGASKTSDCETSTGGIWIQGTNSKLTILNSIISHNYKDSTFSCTEGTCTGLDEGSEGGMNIVGSSCSGSITPAANLSLSYSDFYAVGKTGDSLAVYGISGSGWTTASFAASLSSWQKVDPGFVKLTGDELHLTAESPLINAAVPTTSCTSSTCDPDNTRPDIGPYGGPGGALWDLDLDGYFEWWWYDDYYPRPTGVSAVWDCADKAPDTTCH